MTARTSPIAPIPADLVEGVPESRVAEPSQRDAVGALDAGATEQDHARGRGDGEPAADDAPGPVDPDDTSRCPTGAACDTCGTVDDLAVGTGETPAGVACLTLCGSCAEAGDTPHWSVPSALARVIEHAEHLGTDLDALAAAVRRLRHSGGAR